MTILLLSSALVGLVTVLAALAWAGIVEVDWRATDGSWYFRRAGNGPGREVSIENIPGHVLEVTFGRIHAELFIGRWT